MTDMPIRELENQRNFEITSKHQALGDPDHAT